MFDDMNEEELRRRKLRNFVQSIKSYNGLGFINFDKVDELESDVKQEYIKLYCMKIPTYKEYMANMMEDIIGLLWFFVLPMGTISYFLQRRAIKKYLDKNQEYLI